jgi:hypothetical protein
METQERISGAELGFKAEMDNKKIQLDQERAVSDQLLEGLQFGAEQVHRNEDRNQNDKKADLSHMEKINQLMLQKRQHEANLERQKDQKESKKPKE